MTFHPLSSPVSPAVSRRLTLSLAATWALALIGCSQETPGNASASAPAPVPPGQAYDAVATAGKGFNVGALMAANTVYVLFDPQCPHCSQLWQASQPLLNRARFVWIPVAIISPKSLPQGAALMQASDTVKTMNEHEISLLAGQGGLSASASIPPELQAAIQANTQLLDSLGADAVPFIVAKHARTGQVVTKAGALSTPALTEFLGL